MLDLKCDKCGAQLQQPGALAFSPPREEASLVEKYHLCVDCWLQISAMFKGMSSAVSRGKATHE
jgi:hypothetical protein